ncbi:hypothetical protein Tco_1190137 [Tanacetum coccineum]
MEAHLAPTQPTQVNKVTTLCEICSGPHDTQYCMEDPKQAFDEYASSHTDEAGGLVSNFMASQDARLSKFEADFKQQQSEMTNKMDTVLKAITYQIAGTLPSDTAITIHSEKQSDSYDEKAKENEEEEKNSPENIHVNPSTPSDPSVAFITKKRDDIEVMFIELIRKNDDSSEREPEEEGSTKDLMIVEDISLIIDPRLSQVVLGKPFVETSNMTHDSPKCVVRFTNGIEEVAYKMPHMIEQYNSLSDLEKEHTKIVCLRNEEDKRRGVEYVMSKILGFYKECLELGPDM